MSIKYYQKMVEVIMNLERLGSQYDPYDDDFRRNVCEQWGKAGRAAIQPGYYVFRQQAKGNWGLDFYSPFKSRLPSHQNKI